MRMARKFYDRLREALGEDIQDRVIADMLGVTQGAVSGWRNTASTVNPETIARGAQVIGIPAAQLFEEIATEDPKAISFDPEAPPP